MDSYIFTWVVYIILYYIMTTQGVAYIKVHITKVKKIYKKVRRVIIRMEMSVFIIIRGVSLHELKAVRTAIQLLC